MRKVLVANKIDVEEGPGEDVCSDQPRKISRERGLALALKHGMEYYEVSAKSNEGIADMFAQLSRQIGETISKSIVKNEPQQVDVTVTLNSTNARKIRKVKKMGVEFKIEGETVFTRLRERLCDC